MLIFIKEYYPIIEMNIYYIIFLILSLFAFREIYNPKPLNIYSFTILSLIFSIFIGLRNEIGCDWYGMKNLFEKSLTPLNTSLTVIEYLKFKEIGYTSLSLIIKYIGGNIYILNFVFSLFFVLPFLKFCSTFKRPFLAILVSFPYLITVIGLGTIRQSIAIAFFMVCINELKHLKFYKYYFYNLIGILFHYSSFIFLFLPLSININKILKLKKNFKFLYILFVLILILFFVINNYFIEQINIYLFNVESLSFKSPLIIWIMIFVPSSIILFNYKYYKDDDINKFWRNYSIAGILMIFTIFFNSIISLRLLFYFIPIKIYALANLPEVELFNMSTKNTYLAIIFLSFSILTVWLNFANHSYCYIPYKNLLLN